MSALVVGSMAPDFEYLIRLAPHRTIGHTPLGAFVFCLPASLAVLVVWHRLVEPALAPLFPGGRSREENSFKFGPTRRMATICASVLVGTFSHLLWDSFTHDGGFFVSRLSALSDPVWSGGPAGYVVAWNVSGVVGTVAVAWGLASRLRLRARRHAVAESRSLTAEDRRQAQAARGWTAAGILAGAAGLATTNALRLLAGGASTGQVRVAAVLGAMTGTAAATVTAGVVLRLRSAR